MSGALVFSRVFRVFVAVWRVVRMRNRALVVMGVNFAVGCADGGGVVGRVGLVGEVMWPRF